MLPRIVLILLQVAASWFIAPQIIRYIPIGGDLRLFVYAVIFAILVWVVGLVSAEILKDTARPSPSTLTAALVCALACAGLTLIPGLVQAIPFKFNILYFPLAGAILGYLFVK